MRTQVFISYRRDGGLESAQFLYSQLKDNFEVFFDMESLRSGKFDENIEQAILDCTDFLLILSNNIFDRFEEDGDWISRELSLALANRKNLIPIFLPGFVNPNAKNKTIQTAMRYNGIHLAQDEKFTEKLRSFLKSNKKCVLPIACKSHGYLLTETAVNALKEAYRDMAISKEYKVHVVLQFPDAVKSAETFVPALLFGDARKEKVEAISQRLIRRRQAKQRCLEVAIEYMMSDTSNLDAAPLQPILIRQGLAQETYFDQNGQKRSYYYVAVWAQIIEELMLEITISSPNRLTFYRNRRNEFTAIDCVVDRVAHGINKNWHFTSHANPDELTLENQTWYPLLKPGVLTLKPETLLQCILPDFYYKVAQELCFGHSQQLNELLLTPGADIRFLANYWYGLS